MQSNAKTVEEYLSELDDVRRPQIAALRKHFKKHMPKGFVETMAWGMICYEVPLKVSGPTYNGQPLVYAGLASQKQHISIYLMTYESPEQSKEFKRLWTKDGRKLDMGKACIRFKKIEDASLEAIAYVLGAMTPAEYVAYVESVHPTTKKHKK